MKKNYSIDQIKVPRFNEKSGFYTTPQRSTLMSKIRANNTKPEMILRKELYKIGLRYRIHMKTLPGNPDIVFTKRKVAIFVDGEFWHGHNWEEKKIKIKTNRDFWIPKIERNMQRDLENNLKLESDGFKVIRFWEKEIKTNLQSCINQIVENLNY